MSVTLPADLAYRILKLEQQLESYQRLHLEELTAMRRVLSDLKEQILVLAARKETEKEEERDG